MDKLMSQNIPLVASSSLTLPTSNIASWPIEWLVIVGLVVFIVLWTLRSGTGAATALALAFPLAAFLYLMVPSAWGIGAFMVQYTEPLWQAFAFAIIFIFSLLCLYRIVTCYDSLTGGSVFGVLAAIAVGILLIVTWLEIPALQALWHISTPIASIFADQFRFWWILLALSILTYVRS